jgi:hypothetical protein
MIASALRASGHNTRSFLLTTAASVMVMILLRCPVMHEWALLENEILKMCFVFIMVFMDRHQTTGSTKQLVYAR